MHVRMYNVYDYTVGCVARYPPEVTSCIMCAFCICSVAALKAHSNCFVAIRVDESRGRKI